jgi:hypothetical protein
MSLFAETAIVDYRLSFADQGKQLPFSVSVCDKQTEVSHFNFPIGANKRRSPFSFSPVFGVLKRYYHEI